MTDRRILELLKCFFFFGWTDGCTEPHISSFGLASCQVASVSHIYRQSALWAFLAATSGFTHYYNA